MKTHQPCEDCGSSDALTVYPDGHSFCFSCGSRLPANPALQQKEKLGKDTTTIPQLDYFNENRPEEPTVPSRSDEVKTNGPTPVDPDRIVSIPDRGITKESARRYSIWVNPNGEHVYPYYRDGRLVANKFRTAKEKGFLVQGEINRSGLFGQQAFEPGSAKQVTLLEGELDAPSAYQMFGMKWPCVSVKSASSARKDVADNFEYLNSFDQIVVCFDKDEPKKRNDGTVFYPGQDAAQKVASMFELGKVRVLTLRDAKDANDYLMKGWNEKFQKEWWGAPEWTPVGLRVAKDMWEEVRKSRKYDSVPYPWDGLNRMTYGIRLSELVTLTANSGVGKSSVVKEITHQIMRKISEEKDSSRGIGLMMLEEPNQDTLLGLMSITANKPLHLPDVFSKTSEDELRKYFDATYNDEKVVLWDHFGSNEIQKVLDSVRYMHNLGCKYIILDHLSIVVSDQSGDERKQLDEISTKLKQLCMELNVAIIVIIHQNRKGEIRGTAGVEQLSNIVIKLYRDVKNPDEEVRNTTQVIIEKNRFCGRTGPACLLSYDGATGRLMELPDDALIEYGEKTKKKEEDW